MSVPSCKEACEKTCVGKREVEEELRQASEQAGKERLEEEARV